MKKNFGVATIFSLGVFTTAIFLLPSGGLKAEDGKRVYIVGKNYPSVSYWVDGVKKELSLEGYSPEEGDFPEVGSVVIAGGKVYVLGQTGYWVDGVRKELLVSNAIVAACKKADGDYVTKDNIIISASSIAVDGGDVHVLGWYGSNIGGHLSLTGYWVNGVHVNLRNAPWPNVSMAFSNKKLHIAGTIGGVDGGQTKAFYWFNGVKKDLPDKIDKERYITTSFYPYGVFPCSKANSIRIAQGKIYIAGNYGADYVETIACYWINGVKTDLPGSGESFKAAPVFEEAKDIAIDGKDVYVIGYISISEKPVACYWKNGVRTNLDGKDASVNAIAIVDGKVYIAGHYNDGKQKACYWVNGEKKDLPDGELHSAVSISVE
jgi:hypothetical protein